MARKLERNRENLLRRAVGTVQNRGMRTLTAALVALLLFGLVEAGPTETVAPPQLLSLEIEGGGKTSVEIDKPFTAMINGKLVKMKLTANPLRSLEIGGVSLRYPRSFTFEYELDAGVHTWSIEGPATMLMLIAREDQTPAAFLKEMEASLVDLYGAETRVSDTEITIQRRVLKGRRLSIQIAGSLLRQDLYSFKTGARTYCMIVQDSLTADGKTSQGTREVLKLLSETLKIK